MTADVIEQVVMLTGRVLHGGTGKPVDGTVTIAADGEAAPARFLEDGTFALFGRPEVLFPDSAVMAYTVQLNVTARSTQWRTGGAAVALPPVTIPVGHDFAAPGGMLTVPSFPAAAPAGTVLLPADPAVVRGRVVRAELPVAGATVEVQPPTGPPLASQVTDADGRYGFAPLPIPPESSVRCTSGGLMVERRLTIDYALAVNTENFRLPPP